MHAESNIFDYVPIQLSSTVRVRTLPFRRCGDNKYTAAEADECGICGGTGECFCDGIRLAESMTGVSIDEGCFHERVEPGVTCGAECAKGYASTNGTGAVVCGDAGKFSELTFKCIGTCVRVCVNVHVDDSCVCVTKC